MTTKTKTKPDNSGLSNWPPVAHLVPENEIIDENTRALCGAKLMGLELPNAKKICKKCLEIAEREIS